MDIDHVPDKLAMENGHVVADDFCRTSVDGVYACGDALGRCIHLPKKRR